MNIETKKQNNIMKDNTQSIESHYDRVEVPYYLICYTTEKIYGYNDDEVLGHDKDLFTWAGYHFQVTESIEELKGLEDYQFITVEEI